MTSPRSTPSDSSPDDPKDRNEVEGATNERGQRWHEECTLALHDHYRKVTYNRARLFITDPYEAMRIAEQVADELAVRQLLPFASTADAYIRQRAQWRALSYLGSSQFDVQSHCNPFLQVSEEDEEEYEAIPVSRCSVSAEEEVLRKEDWEDIKLAIDSLQGLQRACFVLRLIDGRKVLEVAQILNISENYVSQLTLRAANKVGRLLEAQGITQSKGKRKGDS